MFIDPPDYDEIESERQEYLREQEAEAEAEQLEAVNGFPSYGEKSTDDFHTYNSRVDDDYEDDPDNHDWGCTCFLCIPGF